MSRNISYDLSPESIEKAIAELKRYRSELPQKADLVCQKLAELGANVAQMQYNAASGDLTFGFVTVSAEKSGDGWLVTANGREVMFLEFGAGDTTDTGNHLAADAPVDVYPGSWSKKHAKQYSETGQWTFNGKTYTGVKSARGLAWAEHDIRSKIIEVAKEVFNS